MLGKMEGLKARVIQVVPHVNFMHWEVQTLDAELKHVLETAVKMVNYKKKKKTRPLNMRPFTTLCNELGSEDQGLLLHTEVRRLSRGNVLSRLYELWDEVRLFLIEHGAQPAEHLTHSPDWITRLVYLYIWKTEWSLQGENTSIMSLNDKIQAFMRKLERWAARVKMGLICFQSWRNSWWKMHRV